MGGRCGEYWAAGEKTGETTYFALWPVPGSHHRHDSRI